MGRRSRDSDITVDMLLRAYSIGLFPMAEAADDPELFWVEPDLRGIIPLDDFHVSKSLAKAIRKKPFDIRFDTAFSAVMAGCAAEAPDRPNTWINETMHNAGDASHAGEFRKRIARAELQRQFTSEAANRLFAPAPEGHEARSAVTRFVTVMLRLHQPGPCAASTGR